MCTELMANTITNGLHRQAQDQRTYIKKTLELTTLFLYYIIINQLYLLRGVNANFVSWLLWEFHISNTLSFISISVIKQ